MVEGDDVLGVEFFFHGVSDVEKQFDGVEGTLEVAHQKGKFWELGEQIGEIKGDYFVLESFFSDESIRNLVLRQDDYI